MTVPSTLRLAATRSILAWLSTRVLVIIGLVLANIFTNEPEPVALRQGLLSWDASWYLPVAELGYDGAPADAVRYFPLLPLAGRWLAPLFGGRTDIALVVVVAVLALLASVAVHELVRTEVGDGAARAVVWVLALFPTAFVLVSPYSEAALLLFGSCFILGLRRQRWLFAIAVGVLAGLSRPVGALLAVYGLVELLWPQDAPNHEATTTTRNPRKSPLAILAVTSPAIGVASFGVWSSQSGRGFWAPFDAQRGLRGAGRDPVTRLGEALWNGATGDLAELLHGLTAVLCFGLALLLWRRGLRAFAIYGAAGVALALSSTNINSLLRYTHGLLPVLIAVSIVVSAERISPATRRALAALAGAGVVGFTAAMLTQNYVP